MPITKPEADLDLLDGVDEMWRRGDTQEEIARAIGSAGSSGLHIRLARLGFKMKRQSGLVTVLDGRDYAAMRAAGEIVAAEEPAGVAA